MRVAEVMTKEAVTVNPAMSVHDIARLFVEKNISGAPVLDASGALVGIVLEEGVIFQDKKVHLPTFLSLAVGFVTLGAHRLEEEIKKISAISVKDIMQTDFVTVSPQTQLTDAATVMIEKNAYYLPVVEDAQLVGVLTKKDIVRAIAQGEH